MGGAFIISYNQEPILEPIINDLTIKLPSSA
jgi:hypothetical protein